MDADGLALAALLAQGRPEPRAGRSDVVGEPPDRRALAVARLDGLVQLADGAQERHRLSPGARVVAGGLGLRPEVARAQLTGFIRQGAGEVDDRGSDLVDLPLAPFLALLHRISAHVAHREVVGRVDQLGLRRDQRRSRSWVAEDGPQLETQRLQPTQELALVLRRHEEADLQGQLAAPAGGGTAATLERGHPPRLQRHVPTCPWSPGAVRAPAPPRRGGPRPLPRDRTCPAGA